jgi:hypothetical protein
MTKMDLTEAGFESMHSQVERLWICELDQDTIDNTELNNWTRLVLMRLSAVFNFELEKEVVSLFLSATEMDKPIILELETLHLLSQLGSTIEFFSGT